MRLQSKLKLLGKFQLTIDEQPVTGITSEKIQALIAYLAVEQDRVHTREFLAELLWPDRPDGVARQNLRQALSRLQRAWPQNVAPLLTVSRREVQLNHAVDRWVDLVEFVSTLDRIHRHDHVDLAACPACCQALTAAVTHYQGDFLDGILSDSPAYDEWVTLKREWLRREALWMLDTLVQQNEACQAWNEAYRFAWRRVELDPLLEEAHQQVMRALAHSGRRKEALDQFATLSKLLREELDVEPATASTMLFETIRDGQLGTHTKSTRPDGQLSALRQTIPHNLPIQHTPFVGRQQELQRIEERLAQSECHLLTLVGPGGAGKTRLALEAAAQQRLSAPDRYTDGIYLVELATADDAEQLLTAVAAAIGFHFPDEARGVIERQVALVHHLQVKRLLLLFDNYEQLAEFTDLILAVLTEAPHVQLLATSRVPLHLRAEWLLDIVGLTHPNATDLMMEEDTATQAGSSLRSMVTFEAVQFFNAAAQRVLADFTLSDQTLTLVGRLSLLTEGLPLALELAAAQIRAVPLPVLVEAVQRNLDALATTMRDVPARHRSLRAIFDHSWILLTPTLQALFSRLAVFRGTFSAEAAIAVTSCAPIALDQLCAYSLLRKIEADPSAPRYALHEVLRQYATEQLDLVPTSEQRTRVAHSRYYLGLVAKTATVLDSSDAAQGAAAIQQEFDNIRSGWQWAVATADVATLHQCIHPLLRFFVLTGQAEEGGSFFDGALRAITVWLDTHTNASETTRQRAQQLLADLHAMRARMFFKQARYGEGIDHAERALTIAEAADAPRSATLANLYWGICLLNLGEYMAAEEKLTATLTLARSIAWRKAESDALRALGTLADMQNDLVSARHYYERSLTISQELDDPRGSSAALGNVGNICRQQGDFGAARRFLEQSLAIHRRIGDRSSEGRTLSLLGELSTDLEEYAEAERYFGEAIHILRALGEEHYAADALVALGKVYHAQGQSALAVACWEETLPIYEAVNEVPSLAEVRQYLQLVQGKAAASVQQERVNATLAQKGIHRL